MPTCRKVMPLRRKPVAAAGITAYYPRMFCIYNCKVALFTSLLLPIGTISLGAQASTPRLPVEEMMLDQSSAPQGIAPAFSPDDKLVVYGKRVGEGISLFVAEKTGATWSAPHLASFSGQYQDLEPAFDPNGKYLIFSSNRPLQAGGALAEGNYDGQVMPGKGGRLWRVERTATGWGEPTPLPDTVNATTSMFSPSIASDGTLYFMRPVNAGEKFHLYRSKMRNGEYAQPERVSFSNLEAYGDFDPAVAKDGSFLIFSSPRPPSPPHTSDLFIVYRKDDEWSAPVDLRTILSDDVHGVEARLSPDEKTLYFTNGRRLPTDPPDGPGHPYVSHTWEVSLSPLKALVK